MSSIEFEALRQTQDIIRSMADTGVFTPQGTDKIKRMAATSVHKRIGARARENDDGRQSGGERSIELPGVIISHVSHNRPESGGEQDWDTGSIIQIVELIDSTDERYSTNIETYFAWADAIRLRLQLPDIYVIPIEIGDIWFVHVTVVPAPDQNNWIYHRQVRMALQVVLYTKTRRDIEVTP
jgi:hypothetical protein